ncbi:MAG: glycosyltransferase family 2 protein, partial [Candidatus Omnitrophica bacterium]|nr:glycosyltransferase family 2 protein [Candidatus Omnitrophota bacterium]
MEPQNKSKLVSIVIVTRNRKDLVLNCLTSVFRMDYPSFKVVLVDNASQDGTVEAVKLKFPQVDVIASKENKGLNGGKNLGQQRAEGDYIFFLDSDTEVDRNCLKELVDLAESDQDIGMACPKMYYSEPRNIIWYAGSYVNLLTSQTKNIGCNEADAGQWDQVRETQFAPTAYLARMEVVKTLKSHYEYLFMTYGDTDYGFRTKEAGYKVLFCPKARL